MFRSLVAAMSVALLSCPTFAQADEVQFLAQMKKSDFLAVAEDLTLQAVEAQAEMLRRFKEDAVPETMTAPLSSAEREAMSCSWDAMNEKGLLEDYAKQTILLKEMVRLVEEDESFDIVDLFGNPDMMIEWAEDISDEVFDVMNSCGTIEATSPRTAFMFDLFPLMSQEMEARGYEF